MSAPDQAEVLVNGVAGYSISAGDRGFQFGDGAFETIRVRAGRTLLWQRHFSRLLAGLERLRIPFDSHADLEREAQRLSRGARDAVLKIIVTRGEGRRGYAPPPQQRHTRVVSIHPYPDFPAARWREGVALRWCKTRLAVNPALAGIKHLNRLEQVLARAEWDDPRIAEGLMLDTEGRVVEATACNLFIVREGALFTPSLGRCGVAGVMRALIMDLAADLGLGMKEMDLWPNDVTGADEMFLSNCLIGIWPVTQLEDRAIGIGPVTRQLMQRVEDAQA